MEQLLSQICMLMSLYSNIPGNVCINSLNSIYIQSGTKNINDLASKYYENKAYNLLGKEVIYGGAAIFAMGDAYNRKQIHFSAPISPLAENISLDWAPDNYRYQISWKWSF